MSSEGQAKRRLAVFGAGPQGRVVSAILDAQGIAVHGYYDDNRALHGREFCGRQVLGGLDALLAAASDSTAFVSIGSNPARRRVSQRLREAGIELVNAVHPSAVAMPGVSLGTGVLIAPGAILMVGTRVEDDAVVNTSASIDHDSRVGAAAYISPGVKTAGGVDIGNGAFIGLGALLGPGVRIGEGTIVGAGSVVLDELPARVFAVGCPASVKRELGTDVAWGRLLGGPSAQLPRERK